MKKGYTEIVIPVLVTLLSTVISDAMPNYLLRLLFIALLTSGCILFLNYMDNRQTWKLILLSGMGVTACILLAVPVIQDKTAAGYFSRVRDFFTEKEEPPSPSELYAEDICNRIEASGLAVTAKITETEESLQALYDKAQASEKAEQELESIAWGISALSESYGNHNFFYDLEDSEEVYEILGDIESNNVDDDGEWLFPSLTEERYEVELFYKMKLSSLPYAYCNIIKAFGEYGIDCETMDIDEYDLALWDTEMLFSIYNMKKVVEPYIFENSSQTEWHLKFNDNKMQTDGHKDNLDYKDWSFNYTDKPVGEMDGVLDNWINAYYKKFHINFQDTPK